MKTTENQVKEIKLKNILLLEAKEAEFGAKASRARKEYAEKYSPFKKGDKVIVLTRNGQKFSCYGIVNNVSYSTHDFFCYRITPTKKDFAPHGVRMASEYINGTDSYYIIKKATE